MAGDKRKGKEPAVEPRKKTRAEKETERGLAAVAVAERRSRRPDPPFRIRESATAGQTEAQQAEAGASVPETGVEQQQPGPRRSGRARTQAVPPGAPAAAAQPETEEIPVRQGPRTRGGRTSHVTPAGRPRPQRPTAEQIAEQRAAARAISDGPHRQG